MSDEIKEGPKSARRWHKELRLAKREDDKWIKRGKKIVKRYRDERTGWADNTKRYNILWANVQTTIPALYGRTPRADVQRRFKDQDPVGRTAAQIIERALQYEIDHYGDFDATNRSAITDLLLPGRGVAWVRFDYKETQTPEVLEDETQEVEVEEPTYECTPSDYVYWEDFRNSPARCWDEVTWVARRVYMSRADGIKRFGEQFREVPLTHEPIGLDDLKNAGADSSDIEEMKKAQVWEIWDKTSKQVVWIADGFENELDSKEDPYGLDNFWPCPRPLYATQTTDTLVPVPDYAEYQDQAEELDRLTNRISMLVDAVKVVGVYDASQAGVQRMFNEGVNNTLIPIDTWAAFGEKGGLKGVVDFLPLDMVIQALRECYVAREACKTVIYEITGLSDIIRGSSVASETATAQQIKSQYGSLRLRRRQTEVAQFASEILRIKAQLMADLYRPETLIAMSGIMGTDDAQYAEQAIALIKSEPMRNFRIEVAADSLVEMDEQAEKQSRMEFLQATGAFMQQALPVVQQAPEMAPLIAEMLLFGVRSFKGARQIEAAFDTAMAQLSQPKPPAPPPPDPEQIKMQGLMQIEQGKGQLEMAKMQGQSQMEQLKLQQASQIEQFKAQNMLALEQMKQDAETARAEMKANIEAQTRLTIAQMQSQAAIDSGTEKQVGNVKDDVVAGIGELVSNFVAQISEAMENQRQSSEQAISAIQLAMNSPKKIVRGPDGRAIGVEVNGVVKTIERGPDGRAIGV